MSHLNVSEFNLHSQQSIEEAGKTSWGKMSKHIQSFIQPSVTSLSCYSAFLESPRQGAEQLN